MRRRFGRGRRGRGPDARDEIDARRLCERIQETRALPLETLVALEVPGVPVEFAVLAEGASPEGRRFLVGFAPRRAADAALAVLAEAGRHAAAEGFAGEAVALAPQWTGSARRRLALLAPRFAFRALAVPALAEGGEAAIAAEPPAPAPLLPARQLVAGLARAADRELLARALTAFEGLAAKHGGAVRGVGGRIELVLLARASACLRAEADGISLDTLLPDRSSSRLALADLAAAMDRLEGTLRRRLNDRRTRGGEEGLRADLLPALAGLAGMRGALRWPQAGADPDVIDLLGVGEDGRPALGAIRERLSLAGLAALLDAALELVPSLPWLLAAFEPPVRIALPRLLIAAREFDPAALHALAGLTLEHALCDIEVRRGREPELRLREAVLPAADFARPEAARPRPIPELPRPAPERPRPAPERPEPSRPADAWSRPEGRAPLPGAGEDREEVWDEGSGAEDEPAEERGDLPAPGQRAAAPRIEEISLFDLDDSGRGAAAETPDRRRRRGRRRRGRRAGPRALESGPGGLGPREPDAPDLAPGAEPEEGLAGERPPRDFDEDEPDEPDARVGYSTDDEVDLPETLAPLAAGAEELEDRAARALAGEVEPEPEPEEPEEEAGDEGEPEEEGLEDESAPAPRPLRAAGEPAGAAPARLPRRRSAFVVHADRGSLLAAILLARDLRLLEGFWVYPQAELMTFFRGAATDLKEETPIYVVGFTASPARDALQVASLYRGRLAWFDHHDWPPEDLEALRGVLGPEHVHVSPGSGSPLPSVLTIGSRRSRFSDKLVELLTGRFSEHDYDRWGRLWWHRLGELAGRTGERRADIDPLLVGRPSDLARGAARVPPPPAPPEVEYVASHDFRLVHFGGTSLVVVPTPPGLDRYLAARVARERYEAQLSLAFSEGGETLSLAADEARGQRGLDLSGMAEHLSAKHDWIEALPDEDRIACLRVRGLAARPELLDEVIREIGMGRSILEG